MPKCMTTQSNFIKNIIWDLEYNYNWLVDNIAIADDKEWYYHVGCVNTASFVLTEKNYITEKLDHEVNKITHDYRMKNFNHKYEKLESLYEFEF